MCTCGRGCKQQTWSIITISKSGWPMLSYGPFDTLQEAGSFASRELKGHNICYHIIPSIPISEEYLTNKRK